MKINGPSNHVTDVTPVQKPSQTIRKSPAPHTGDEVDISSKAREAMRIMEAVKQAPDVREARVRALKEAIEAGTYKVEGTDVAEKLVKESMLGSIL